MTSEQCSNKEILIMLENVSEQVRELAAGQKQIQKQLAGNGGPGILTRLHALEMAREATKKAEILAEENEHRIERLENVAKGVMAALVILEALRWIVPLFTP